VDLVDEQHVARSRFVSSAARSPGRSSTGPDVCRRFTFNSLAMMLASVVFPDPAAEYQNVIQRLARWRAA